MRSFADAEEFFATDPVGFERAIVARLGGECVAKRIGVDGVIRSPEAGRSPVALISVKAGSSVAARTVRDLAGRVKSDGARVGLLVTMSAPSPELLGAANAAGVVSSAAEPGVPRVQILTVGQVLRGERPTPPDG